MKITDKHLAYAQDIAEAFEEHHQAGAAKVAEILDREAVVDLVAQRGDAICRWISLGTAILCCALISSAYAVQLAGK